MPRYPGLIYDASRYPKLSPTNLTSKTSSTLFLSLSLALRYVLDQHTGQRFANSRTRLRSLAMRSSFFASRDLLLYILVIFLLRTSVADVETSNTTANASGKEGSFAELIDRALEKEFPDSEQTSGGSGSRDLYVVGISFYCFRSEDLFWLGLLLFVSAPYEITSHFFVFAYCYRFYCLLNSRTGFRLFRSETFGGSNRQ